MDWNRIAPQDVRDDVDNLLRDAVNAVAQVLEEADSFAPFMLVVEHSGRKVMRMPERPNASIDEQTHIEALQAVDDRTTLRARVSVFDVTVSTPFTGAAIKATVEHCTGLAIDVLVPYQVTADEVRIDLEAANRALGPRKLWP